MAFNEAFEEDALKWMTQISRDHFMLYKAPTKVVYIGHCSEGCSNEDCSDEDCSKDCLI